MTGGFDDPTATPSPTSLLVYSIRGRIVEYKELLLRQLVDQRVALLAIDDVAAVKTKRVRDEQEERANVTVDATPVKAKAEEGEQAPSVRDEATAIANGHSDVQTVDIELNGSRKRSASPTEPLAEAPVSVQTPETTAPKAEPRVEHVFRVVKRRRSSVSLDMPLAAGGQTVQRTSMPPRRYLEHRDEEDGMDQDHVHLVLRSPRPNQRTASSRQTQLQSKSATHSKSIDDIHAEFEQKLRVTSRLQREVAQRSVAATRKRQLPRLPMPARTKSHWDFLLEEMRLVAMDFSAERNWKRALQWHLAKEVVVKLNEERVRREKENRQRAREMAMQVAAFWRSMERIAARSHSRFEQGANRDKNEPVGKVEETTETSADDAIGDEDKAVVLKYKTIELTSPEEVHDVEEVKQRLQMIVSSSRTSRRFLRSPTTACSEEHEGAIQRLLEGRSSSAMLMLTTFQLVALRWMLTMCASGFNVLLNDQLGMGKASTVAACLRVLQILYEAAQGDDPAPLEMSRPHLVIVPSDEVHKWCHYLRCWNEKSGIIQVYGGTAVDRTKQQRAWTKKLNVPSFFSSEEVADLEEEDKTPLFACVCTAEDFLADQTAFAVFSRWQCLVVEKDARAGTLFEDIDFIGALAQLPHTGRRIVTSSQPLDSWSSSKIRTVYGGFLLNIMDEHQHDVWNRKTVLDKSSALEVVKWLVSSSSSTLKTQAQQDQLSAMNLALHCLTVRRVRSEVESQFGKLDEQSIPCKLTTSQKTQYRNAVTAFVSTNTAGSKDRMDHWLTFFLQLRRLCNCVDLLNDAEKLALADLPFLFSSSTKLENLHELLSRLLVKDKQRVVIYCQLDAMFPVVEMLLALMEITFVQITGSIEAQRRALSHFALRPSVHVALVSTRLGCSSGRLAMPVYGADSIIVLDSDWQSTSDAKLRASWAKCLVGKPTEFTVFRFHCDATIEGALLRGGSCLTDKILGELTPQEVVGDAGGASIQKLHKPAWWSAGSGAGAGVPSLTSSALEDAEASDKYSATELDASSVLKVVDVELDADEHLLLANADELMPVEWYAVNYVHTSAAEKKRSSESEQDEDGESFKVAGSNGVHRATTFEQIAVRETRQAWQDGDAMEHLFYFTPDAEMVSVDNGKEDGIVNAVLRPLRELGLEPHYDLLRLPSLPTGVELMEAEPFANDMMFKVSYREPASPAPVPTSATSLTFKLHPDGTTTLAGTGTDKQMKMKKRNKDLSGRLAAAAGTSGVGGAAGAAGVKRKHENASAGAKPLKEPRLDFDGIPIPQDMSEFADDDFWGDTNLDALDSATWDDPAVLSGILGPTLDASPSKAPAGSGAGGSATGGTTGTTKKKSKANAAGAGQGGSTGTTGRVRKGSISGDSSKDGGWQVQDDLILKKLFELYGSNWTLIAHVLNTSTSVSRFVFRRRTPRQCYDRYGKIISSGGLTGSSATPLKDSASSKSLVKQQKLNAAAAVLWTPQVLAERVGLPTNEVLMIFHARDSLPGLPPPSVNNVPTLVELSLKKKKKTQKTQPAPTPTDATTPAPPPTTTNNGLDDLKPLRTSFDAIINCMKRKTPPPPIPIPQPTPAAAATATPVENVPQVSPSKRTGPSIVTPVPTTITAPHKSHLDLVEMLPRVPLAPDEVIKRSKEAAAVAVQAAAAVASASSSGRVPGAALETSPLASAGDAMTASGFNSAALAARKAAMNSRIGNGLGGAAGISKLGGGPSAGAWGDPSAAMRPPQPPHAVTTTGAAMAMAATSVNGVSPRSAAARPNAAMPVTTSALLHVLDRMPEIKHKIQAILNRNDCSEPQKVAMIARLLSNTNAINATAVAAAASGNLTAAVSATLGASASATTVPGQVPATASTPTAFTQPPVVRVAATAGLDTPIPMPAALAIDATSSAISTSSGSGSVSTAIAADVVDAAASDAIAAALEDTDLADLA